MCPPLSLVSSLLLSPSSPHSHVGHACGGSTQPSDGHPSQEKKIEREERQSVLHSEVSGADDCTHGGVVTWTFCRVIRLVGSRPFLLGLLAPCPLAHMAKRAQASCGVFFCVVCFASRLNLIAGN